MHYFPDNRCSTLHWRMHSRWHSRTTQTSTDIDDKRASGEVEWAWKLRGEITKASCGWDPRSAPVCMCISIGSDSQIFWTESSPGLPWIGYKYNVGKHWLVRRAIPGYTLLALGPESLLSTVHLLWDFDDNLFISAVSWSAGALLRHLRTV